MSLLTFAGVTPELHPGSWAAGSATIVGRVTLEAGASCWFGSVIRAEAEPITIGSGSNIQDTCVLHTDQGFPLVLGASVSVGHGAVLHGCTIEDEVLIGMGAVVMNGAVVGRDSIIAAGALVPEGMVVPSGSLVTGVPGKVRRPTTPVDQDRIKQNAAHYRELARVYAAM